jgi:hypothetical protein
MHSQLGSILWLAIYIFMTYGLMTLGRKVNVGLPDWMAYVPFVNLYYEIKVVKKPWWWLLLMLVPLVNFIVIIRLFMLLAEAGGKNKWIGLLLFVPIINFAVWGYIVWGENKV